MIGKDASEFCFHVSSKGFFHVVHLIFENILPALKCSSVKGRRKQAKRKTKGNVFLIFKMFSNHSKN